MLLIIGSASDQSQTKHFCTKHVPQSCLIAFFFFFINNGEENTLKSAVVIAKVDICFLLASILLIQAYCIS